MGDEVLAMRSLHGALNVFFYIVMKVLMFIELVSGVKYPKITTVGFVLKRPFVDVLSSCRSFLLSFFIYNSHEFGIMSSQSQSPLRGLWDWYGRLSFVSPM